MKNSLLSILSDGKWRPLQYIRFQLGLSPSLDDVIEGVLARLVTLGLLEVNKPTAKDPEKMWRKKQPA